MWWLFLTLGLIMGVMIYGRIALHLVNRVRDRHPDTAAYIPILWSGYREEVDFPEPQRLTSSMAELDGYWLRLRQVTAANRFYVHSLYRGAAAQDDGFGDLAQQILPLINFAARKS